MLKLGDKSLLDWTLSVLHQAGIGQVVLSSDSQRILTMADKYSFLKHHRNLLTLL